MRFLEQARKNLENLSDTKVLYVTKGCLENLARVKSALRVRKTSKKKFIFGATDFYPSHMTMESNQICKCLPNYLKCAQKCFFITLAMI